MFISALQQLHYETLTTTTIIFTFHLGLWQRLLVLFSFYIPHCFIPSSLNSICIIIPYNSHAYIRLLSLDGVGRPSHVHTHSLYSHSHSLYCKSTIPLYPISIHHAPSPKMCGRPQRCVSCLLAPILTRADLQSGTLRGVDGTSSQEYLLFQRILAPVCTV